MRILRHVGHAIYFMCLCAFIVLLAYQSTQTTQELSISTTLMDGYDCQMLSKYTSTKTAWYDSDTCSGYSGTSVCSVDFTGVMGTYASCTTALSAETFNQSANNDGYNYAWAYLDADGKRVTFSSTSSNIIDNILRNTTNFCGTQPCIGTWEGAWDATTHFWKLGGSGTMDVYCGVLLTVSNNDTCALAASKAFRNDPTSYMSENLQVSDDEGVGGAVGLGLGLGSGSM